MSRVRKKQRKNLLVSSIIIAIMLPTAFFIIIFSQDQEVISTEAKEKITYKNQLRPFGLSIKNEVPWNREHEPIRITFVGDLMMDWSVKETMNSRGVDYPFSQVKEDLQKANIAVANLETSVTTRDESFKDRNQLYNFQSNPEHIQGLVNAGFDLVSLANNHALDYGEEGLIDSMETLDEFGVDYIGAGYSLDEAFQAKSYEINGKKINIMSASRFVPSVDWYTFHSSTKAGVAGAYDLDLLVQQVKKQKEASDYLILYIHWGIEKTDIPAQYQKYYVEKLVDAGVDAIVGHHPHWLQGFEYYDGVPVAYSLGNFLFPDYVNGNTAETGLLSLTIYQDEITMEFNPYYIKNDQITSLSEGEQTRILNKLENISYDVSIDGYQIVNQR